MSFASAYPRRVVRGFGALVLADLITGLTGFSVITSGTLWVFSLGWIRLQAEYNAVGRPFGSTAQLGLAWFGVVSCLPVLVGTLYLATRAYRLPRALLHYCSLSHNGHI
jgi:hypothetical protein